MITDKTFKALTIIKEKSGGYGITPKDFSVEYLTGTEHEDLLSAVSNIGNGAAQGVKAWRFAGAWLGKMEKQGLIRRLSGGGYIIARGGELALDGYVAK